MSFFFQQTLQVVLERIFPLYWSCCVFLNLDLCGVSSTFPCDISFALKNCFMKAVDLLSWDYHNYITVVYRRNLFFQNSIQRFVSNKLISYPIIFLVCTRYRFLFPTEISSMPFRSTVRAIKSAGTKKTAATFSERALVWNFIPPARRVGDEGWDTRAISVINKVHVRESRTLVSLAGVSRVPISAAARRRRRSSRCFFEKCFLDSGRRMYNPLICKLSSGS